MVKQENDAATKPKPSLFRRVFGRKDAGAEQPEPPSAQAAASAPDEFSADEILRSEILSGEVLTLDNRNSTPNEILPHDREQDFGRDLVEPADAESPPDVPPSGEPSAPVQKRSWWSRLRQGLARSSNSIGSGLIAIFTKRKLDAAMLDDLEDVLIRADLGVATASRIAKIVGKGRYDKNVEVDEVKAILAAEVERVLAPVRPAAGNRCRQEALCDSRGRASTAPARRRPSASSRPNSPPRAKSVLLAAGDTFRAAAIEQLLIWGARLHCPGDLARAGRRRLGARLRRDQGGAGAERRRRC